jgi:hypothetical protein
MVGIALGLLLAQGPTGGAPPGAGVELPPAPPPLGASWEFTIEPLLWIPSLEGEGGADGGNEVDLDRGYDDFFGELDAGFLLAFEARMPHSQVALIADGLWVRFTDDEGSVETETEVAMVEVGAAYELGRSGFEPTAGLRWVGLSLDVEVGGLDASSSASWIDPWLGARWRRELWRGFDLTLRGDVGGFGVGSDFTWQALAALRITLGDHWSFDVGYRALSVDFDDDDLDYDALAHGPVIGLAFAW